MARKAAAQIDENVTPPEPAPVLNEDVEVLLEPESEPAGEQPTQVETAPPAPAPQPEPTPPAPAEDQEKATLRQRLAEMERAEQMARQALQQERQALAQGRWQSQRQVFDAQYDAVTNSLGAAQSALDAHTQELEGAANESNWKRVAELQAQIGRLGAQVENLEQRKNWMDGQLEAWKQQQQRPQPPPQQYQQPQQPRQPTQPDVAVIIANSGLPERAKQWLRQHPDYITDAEKNAAMQKLHYVAEYQTGQAFSDAYFSKMEELLGFKQPAGNGSATATEQSKPSQRQSAPASAPPTREAPSMATGRAPQPTKVTLNGDEREIAAQIRESRGKKADGTYVMTQAEAEREYARNKLRMLKSDGKMS